MIFPEKDDGAGRLDVKRAGGMKDRVLDELDDAGVGDWRFFLYGDDGAAVNGGLEEVEFGG